MPASQNNQLPPRAPGGDRHIQAAADYVSDVSQWRALFGDPVIPGTRRSRLKRRREEMRSIEPVPETHPVIPVLTWNLVRPSRPHQPLAKIFDRRFRVSSLRNRLERNSTFATYRAPATIRFPLQIWVGGTISSVPTFVPTLQPAGRSRPNATASGRFSAATLKMESYFEWRACLGRRRSRVQISAPRPIFSATCRHL
jgi:hypothetical protein